MKPYKQSFEGNNRIQEKVEGTTECESGDEAFHRQMKGCPAMSKAPSGLHWTKDIYNQSIFEERVVFLSTKHRHFFRSFPQTCSEIHFCNINTKKKNKLQRYMRISKDSKFLFSFAENFSLVVNLTRPSAFAPASPNLALSWESLQLGEMKRRSILAVQGGEASKYLRSSSVCLLRLQAWDGIPPGASQWHHRAPHRWRLFLHPNEAFFFWELRFLG